MEWQRKSTHGRLPLSCSRRELVEPIARPICECGDLATMAAVSGFMIFVKLAAIVKDILVALRFGMVMPWIHFSSPSVFRSSLCI